MRLSNNLSNGIGLIGSKHGIVMEPTYDTLHLGAAGRIRQKLFFREELLVIGRNRSGMEMVIDDSYRILSDPQINPCRLSLIRELDAYPRVPVPKPCAADGRYLV